MDRDLGAVSRRHLLALLGAGGAGGLAGCGEESDGGTETDAGSADGTGRVGEQPSLEAEVAVRDGKRSQVIEVRGVARAPSGVDAVVLNAGEANTRVDVDGSTRRRFEAELHVAGGRTYEIEASVVGRDGTRTRETIETDHVPIYADAIDTDRLVGAHYYPWYEMHAGHRNWTDRTTESPVLGEYTADDPALIDRHLKWCLEHGIRWLSMSWWGPGEPTDDAIRESFLEAERSADIEFSILYETVGRLEEFAFDLDRAEARDRLAGDLAYLEETYFGRDNYLHLDGRPVVFFYVASQLRGDVVAAFEAVTRELSTDPYVLADVPFGSPANSYPVARVADAVTSYNPYTDRPDIAEVFHELFREGNEVMQLGAEVADLGYVSVVIPGYDDTELPDFQREDNPVLSASPKRFERVCDEVAPHLADAEAVLVTSFNEWYENTQVEPSEAYGTEYLELTADRLATGVSPGFEVSGTRMQLRFDETVVPAEVNPDNGDVRELAFMAGELRLMDGRDVLRKYDIGVPSAEPLFLGGVFGPESGGGQSWRWFGGASAETTIQFEDGVASADAAVLVGQPMVSDEIEADVVVDGTTTDHVAFGKRDGFDEYELSLAS